MAHGLDDAVGPDRDEQHRGKPPGLPAKGARDPVAEQQPDDRHPRFEQSEDDDHPQPGAPVDTTSAETDGRSHV